MKNVRDAIALSGFVAMGVGLWWLKPAVCLIAMGSLLLFGSVMASLRTSLKDKKDDPR